MAEQLHPGLTSAKQSVSCGGVNHIASGLYSSGDLSSGERTRTSLSGNAKDESGFGSCHDNGTCLTAL